jgi:DNA-binding transcriptional MerR regulator
MMRIGAFSRLGRISVKALHHYEAIGLLAPAYVDAATGYRYYEPEQLQELRQLLALRALGLPLAHIRDAVHKPLSLKQLQQMLNERKYLLGRQIGAARVQLAAIEARLKQLNADTTCLPLNVVVHPVPAVVVASLRRVVPQHGAVTELFDEISSKLPPSARIIGYGAVWHSCSRETRKIDCEAIALLEQPTRKFDGLRIYELAGCDAACVLMPKTPLCPTMSLHERLWCSNA